MLIVQHYSYSSSYLLVREILDSEYLGFWTSYILLGTQCLKINLNLQYLTTYKFVKSC